MSKPTTPDEGETCTDLLNFMISKYSDATPAEYEAFAELLIFVSNWKRKHYTLVIEKSQAKWRETKTREAWRLTITKCPPEKGGSNE